MKINLLKCNPIDLNHIGIETYDESHFDGVGICVESIYCTYLNYQQEWCLNVFPDINFDFKNYDYFLEQDESD